MNPAAVSHVLMKIEHRFTNFIELLVGKALQHTAVIFNIQTYHYSTVSGRGGSETNIVLQHVVQIQKLDT